MLIGKEFGPYVVEKELGSGAMGAVFLARSKKTGELVALKLMSAALGSSETAHSRFIREVAILKQLEHVNIVKYKGSGRYHGTPFYIMEFVEGESLDHILAKRKRLPWDEVIKLGLDLCAGLQHAHEQGIIHRDLKPSNLMILKDGTVKLTDFGIAKDTDVTALTADNSTVGTAAYMSPEQCRGTRDLKHTSDLYSMGIMFYELLTGRKPFVGETAMEVFLQHANNTEYKRVIEIVQQVPIWLSELVDQLMAKDPNKRPRDAEAVRQSLMLIKQKIAAKNADSGSTKEKKKKTKLTPAEADESPTETSANSVPLARRKKFAPAPFYTKGWFTVLALGLIGTMSCVGGYVAFLRTASAESLYQQAVSLRTIEPKAAREGPIADFLRHYPAHEKVTEVQGWADKIDFELLEHQMLNRRRISKKLNATDNDVAQEQIFRDALDDEEAGKLADAAKKWTDLSQRKTNTDPDLRTWGLVGERYQQRVKAVQTLYGELREKAGKGDGETEQMALDAVRSELAVDKLKDPDDAGKHRANARNQWEDLKKSTDTTGENRRWHVLAAWRWRELRDTKTSDR